ncbi:MAG: hypothetical protein ACK4IY_03260 [Chitinophagales bacterium]
MNDDVSPLPDPASNPAIPYLHEMLVRDAAYNAKWNKWFFSNRYLEIQKMFQTDYLDPDETELKESLVRHFANANESVKILYTHTKFETYEMQFIADALKYTILQKLPYKTYMSDVRHFIRKDYVEVIERHYLKPKFVLLDGAVMVQQFGNIIIENRIIDNDPYDLQLRAHSYSGHNYAPAQEFYALLEILFS